MKTINITDNEWENLKILSFGTEEISGNAHWGKGVRYDTIIHYVLKGEGYFNGTPVKEGQGFLIKKNTLCEYHSSENNPWKYFWVILNGTEDEKICRKYLDCDKNGIFNYDFKDELKNFAKSFFGKYKNLSYVRATGIFFMLMSYHKKEEKPFANKYVSETKKYIEQNCYRNISVNEIAKNLHISDRYLYNLFIKHENISPKQFINKVKLEKACEILKNTSNTITEVALSVGFNDVLTFSRFFSKHMKMSPSEYRKKKTRGF